MNSFEEIRITLPRKFREISDTLDGERDFLEAISRFRIAEEKGWIADSGYRMPDLGSYVVGVVHGIEFVPDKQDQNNGQIIIVKNRY
jgi:hypothetical protein